MTSKIRAGLLATIKKAYDANPNLVNLMIDEGMKKALISNQKSWRRVVTLCVAAGIPAPAASLVFTFVEVASEERRTL